MSATCPVRNFKEPTVKRHILLSTCLLFLVACNTEEPAAQATEQVVLQPEQILLHNAKIYTMDAGFSTASAMLFDAEGQIHDVGDEQAMLEVFPGARRVDLKGRVVIPGLIDSHAHLYGLAISLSQAQLQGTEGKEEIIRKLREHEQSLAADDWLLGQGWDQNDWPIKEFPSRHDLDTAFPDRPVWLGRIDGHAGWANSAALAMADQDLSGDWQPDGGYIHRDAEGQASGVLIDGAMSLVESTVPEISRELLVASLDLALQHMVSLGLTGVHDMGVDQSVVELFQGRIRAGKFPTRAYMFTDGAGETLDWLCARGAIGDESGRLIMRAVKLYIDGAMGSRGAALQADYEDEPGNTGLLFMPPQALQANIEKSLACGLQVGVHAIGDLGNKVALDALESAMQRHPDNPGRHRVEHAQTLTPEDIPRFAELDVIAAMQPTHATSDMYWVEDRLGPERVRYAYPWRSLVDSGARLALGSDFPVEKVSPFLGIYAAISRQDVDGWPPGGWYPQEALSREEAVRGFTLDAAYSGFMEGSVGSLEVGKRADFVVLDRDIFEVAMQDIPATVVIQTWLDGEIVYQAP
jgi:predicted amidohydrolase YtcJ